MNKLKAQLGTMLVSLLLLSACATATDNKLNLNSELASSDDVGGSNVAAEEMASKKESVYAIMNQLIGMASCESNAECASMPVGNATCGGPADYMVYSKSIGLDAISELKKLSDQSKELDIAMAKLDREQGNGVLGICMFNSPTEVACVENMCQKVSNKEVR